MTNYYNNNNNNLCMNCDVCCQPKGNVKTEHLHYIFFPCLSSVILTHKFPSIYILFHISFFSFNCSLCFIHFEPAPQPRKKKHLSVKLVLFLFWLENVGTFEAALHMHIYSTSVWHYSWLQHVTFTALTSLSHSERACCNALGPSLEIC